MYLNYKNNKHMNQIIIFRSFFFFFLALFLSSISLENIWILSWLRWLFVEFCFFYVSFGHDGNLPEFTFFNHFQYLIILEDFSMFFEKNHFHYFRFFEVIRDEWDIGNTAKHLNVADKRWTNMKNARKFAILIRRWEWKRERENWTEWRWKMTKNWDK